jgi:hypothetical protein
LFASSAVIVVLVGLTGLTLYVLLRHEPTAYAQAAIAPGPEREQASKACDTKLIDLVNNIRCQPEWEGEFTEHEINSFLAEDFLKSNYIKLPDDVSDPRITLRDGNVIVGFRYGSGELSSIITVQARVWLPRREPNVVALEIEQLRSGSLPMAVKFIQDELTEAARKQQIDVQWYRHEGNPVVVLRFQADRREPTFQLRELLVRNGSLFLKGRTHDPDPEGGAPTIRPTAAR